MNKDNKSCELNSRVYDHLKDYRKRFDNDFFFISLQGSQNYNLDTDKSDVDTKMAALPTLKDLCRNHTLNTIIIRDNDEHVEVKDIRHMFEMFKKNNPSYLELLYTDYYAVNVAYLDEWSELRNYREELTDEVNFAKALYGTCVQKKKNMTHATPATEEAIKMYGYNPKDLLHIIRLAHLLVNYRNTGKLYFNKFVLNDKVKDATLRSTCRQLKLDPNFSKEYAEKVADEYLLRVKEDADAILKKENPHRCDVKFLDSLLEEIVEKAVRSELL